MVSGAKASSHSVTSVVAKESVLRRVQFLHAFFNNLDDGTECAINKFVHDTKLGEAANTVKGRATIQRNLDRLEK